MKISTVVAGYFKLDGGAMFGIVPRSLWEKLNPPDEKNLCTWAMRCLLVETAGRKILVDTGIGTKQGDKFRSHFEPQVEADIHALLEKDGLAPEAITDVLLTHLHFDHVGGAVVKTGKGALRPAFPEATYWSNEPHWRWAMNPNAKEKASFLQENFVPLRDAGRLQLLQPEQADLPWMEGIRLRFVYGHTEAMMVPIFQLNGKTVVFGADLLPATYHIPMPYVMSYDVRPLKTLEEKERILAEGIEGDYLFIFEHDPECEACVLVRDKRGRIVAGPPMNIENFLVG